MRVNVLPEKTPRGPMAPPAPGRERAGIQSLERGFSIIEAIAAHRDGLNLKDLSRIVGLHTSTTFHLVQTLVTLGYIRQLPDSKRYRLGRQIFGLACTMLDEVELVYAATPILDELSRVTGEAAHFAIGSGFSAVMIARTSGEGTFQIASHVGVVRPLHCTAIGKILLASMTSDRFEAFLGSKELLRFTPKTICTQARLRREIKTIVESGVAVDDGEFNAELRCLAVGVRDFSGRTIGALGVSAPTWRSSMGELRLKESEVRRWADNLSAEIGGADGSQSPIPPGQRPRSA